MNTTETQEIKLNLGCGRRKLSGFVNLDKDAGWLFQNGLPQYGNNSVDAITLSHTLMYLDGPELEKSIGEIWRVLKIGGILRITEDDTENPLSDTYQKDPKQYQSRQWGIGRRCFTGPTMMREILESAGFKVYNVDETATYFRDKSLMQNFHGGRPRCFFIEGIKIGNPNMMKRDPIKWGTHLPLLVKMFDQTQGDVLEMGTGHFSTPILKWLCEMSGRTLYSYESRKEWFEQAVQEAKPFHKIIFCSNWAEADIERHWGLVLIDHSPGRERHTDIKRLANHASVIVIHDTEPQSENFFHYRSKSFPLFKYRLDFTKYIPWTSAVSNFIDVSKFN